MRIKDPIESVVTRTRVDPVTGCFLFMGCVTKAGYGVVGRKYTHRVMYEHLVGPIPAGLFLCHRCDVRRCWNPSHLFPGTAADNTRDAVSKGRFSLETHCRHGHAYDATNTAKTNGARRCRVCSRLRQQRYRNATASPRLA
jgi:hypothetical protein